MQQVSISYPAERSLVFVVDDQSAGRTILERLIRGLQQEIEVITFADAPAAIAHLALATPDLIVTDFMMPEMDGISFIRHIRGQPECNDVPIIMVTVMDDRNVRYQALDAGATDFLNRPIDQHECQARCRNLLTLHRQQKIISGRAKWLEEQVELATRQIIAREKETLLRLARAGEYRDEDTGNHVLRMAKYSRLIAQTLGCPDAEADAIELAAPMHDIGKIGIPDQILLKPARLTSQEFEVIRMHSHFGYEILRDSPSPYIQLGATIALSHHEKYDGTGYPKGLHGEQIPLAARIAAIADVFDALTSVRPYKGKWSTEQARDHIHGLAGSHFDPACVEAFLRRFSDIQQIRETLADSAELQAEVDSVP